MKNNILEIPKNINDIILNVLNKGEKLQIEYSSKNQEITLLKLEKHKIKINEV